VLSRFNSARRSDVASRIFAIDLANRSLLSDFSAHADTARGRTASDRRARAAPASCHARGTGAVLAAGSGVYGNTNWPDLISHITLVSVITEANVPISTATEAGSIQVSNCARRNVFFFGARLESGARRLGGGKVNSSVTPSIGHNHGLFDDL